MRYDVDEVIRHLRLYKHDSSTYYRARASRPKTDAQRAARFIYLNKTCFNGLYRVNRQGHFNVPFGRHTQKLVVCDESQLRAASSVLRIATLKKGDFMVGIANATHGDTVYCDPPYTTAHEMNGFIEYNARVFSWDDQHRLADAAAAARDRGAFVAISNADHPSIRQLYVRNHGFIPISIERWSTMAASPSKRFPTRELLLVGELREDC